MHHYLNLGKHITQVSANRRQRSIAKKKKSTRSSSGLQYFSLPLATNRQSEDVHYDDTIQGDLEEEFYGNDEKEGDIDDFDDYEFEEEPIEEPEYYEFDKSHPLNNLWLSNEDAIDSYVSSFNLSQISFAHKEDGGLGVPIGTVIHKSQSVIAEENGEGFHPSKILPPVHQKVVPPTLLEENVHRRLKGSRKQVIFLCNHLIVLFFLCNRVIYHLILW